MLHLDKNVPPQLVTKYLDEPAVLVKKDMERCDTMTISDKNLLGHTIILVIFIKLNDILKKEVLKRIFFWFVYFSKAEVVTIYYTGTNNLTFQ